MKKSITLQAKKNITGSSKCADTLASEMACLPLDITIDYYNKSAVDAFSFKFNLSRPQSTLVP